MRSPQKGRGWGVFDVLLMSTKTCVCFITSGALIKEIFMKSIGTWTTANPTLQNQSHVDKTLCRTMFSMFLFSLFCAEPCGATRRKARATSSCKATSSNCSHSSRLVGLWLVFGLVYWLFVVTLSSWCFLPDWQTLCFLLSFKKKTKLWFMVWFDSFEIFVRVRANEEFSWPIIASPELEFYFYFWILHYEGILPQKFT